MNRQSNNPDLTLGVHFFPPFLPWEQKHLWGASDAGKAQSCPHKTESWEETVEEKNFRIGNRCCRDQATGTAVNHSKPHQNIVQTLCTSWKADKTLDSIYLWLWRRQTWEYLVNPVPKITLGRAAWPSSTSTEKLEFRPNLQANHYCFYFKNKPNSSSSCFWSSSPQQE